MKHEVGTVTVHLVSVFCVLSNFLLQYNYSLRCQPVNVTVNMCMITYALNTTPHSMCMCILLDTWQQKYTD